jgi:hypothetical protein
MNSLHITASKLTSLLLAAILLLDLGPATWRAIEHACILIGRISLDLCEFGLAALRVCGN